MSDDRQRHAERARSDPSEPSRFVGFVLSLAHTAAVHFGDVPDPVDRRSRHASNLPAAQQMIDILALLEEKTRGNLTAEERQLIEQIALRAAHALRRGRAKAGSRPSPRASSSLDAFDALRPASRFSAPARRTACR